MSPAGFLSTDAADAPRRRRLRVLHLVGSAEDHGGILSVLRSLSAHGPDLGLDHVVWVNASFTQKRSPSLEVRRSRRALDESERHSDLLWHAFRSLPDLRRLLRSERFDVVHGHSRGGFTLAALWCGLFRQPVAFTNHTYANRTGLYRRCAGWTGFHTVLLTPNMARHYGLPERSPRIRLISACGADAFWSGAPVDRRCEPPVRLVGVGNLVGWKKWDLLARALLQLPEAVRSRLEVDVWGPTPETPEARDFTDQLRALLADPRLAGRFRLRGPTVDVRGALSAADGFVLPSTNEPCSVALIEALALGLPAFVTSSGGNVDLVQDGVTGRHFRPEDAADLAARLQEWVEGVWKPADPEVIRSSVRHRSASAVSAQYRDFYDDFVASTARG